MTQLPVINTFWVGPRLGDLHAACLQSFVRQGHRTVLHVYEAPEDAPLGVELADASKLMNKDRIITYEKTGSLAFAADIFRFELQAAGGGIYVDCDCYCIRPLDDDDYIFGWEDNNFIATSVLKLPADSPTVAAMRAIPTPGFIPPWEKKRRKLQYRFMAAIGRPVPLGKMRWATMGPRGFTYYAHKHGIAAKAQDIDVFYPLNPSNFQRLKAPGLTIEDIATPRSRIIHLWNEMLRHDTAEMAVGSPLDRILQSLET